MVVDVVGGGSVKDGVSGCEGGDVDGVGVGGEVKGLILSFVWVLITDRQTDGRTNERTLVVVESLSRLKSFLQKILSVKKVNQVTFETS